MQICLVGGNFWREQPSAEKNAEPFPSTAERKVFGQDFFKRIVGVLVNSFLSTRFLGTKFIKNARFRRFDANEIDRSAHTAKQYSRENRAQWFFEKQSFSKNRIFVGSMPTKMQRFRRNPETVRNRQPNINAKRGLFAKHAYPKTRPFKKIAQKIRAFRLGFSEISCPCSGTFS